MSGRIISVFAPARSAANSVGLPLSGQRPLTVLHLVALGDASGLERTVQSLCIGLRRREHAVHVGAVGGTEDLIEQFRAPLAHAGVRVHAMILPSGAFFRAKRALARLVLESHPDVVHTHGPRADILAGWGARTAGRPVITTLYGFVAASWKHRLAEGLQRVSLGRFDRVAAISPSLAQQVASTVGASQLRVIPTAWLEPEAPLGRAAARRALALPCDQRQLIGWVGRLSRDKGLDVALRALALLADLPVTLAVVGDGPERAGYQRLATRLNLDGRVHWCGQLPDAGRLFAAFDAFLLTSRAEGTPLVLFEAMAARTPIVATAVGSVPDVVTRGTALVVPPEHPDAVAHALRSVFRNPRHATARASAARTRLLTQYEPQRWVDAYEALYWDVSRKTP